MQGQLIARGTVALGTPDIEEVSAPIPALYATDALASLLYARGMLLGSGTITQGAPLASAEGFTHQTHQPVDLTFRPDTSPICGREFICGVVLAKRVSPTVADDVSVTLKVSQNLHAEMLLRRLGKAYGTEGSFAQGARVVRQFLLNAGLDGDDFIFYDGSGLSGHDLVTPRATAQLLSLRHKAAMVRAMEIRAPRRRRRRHPRRPLLQAATQRPSLRKNRHTPRSPRSLRLSRRASGKHRHLFHHGRQPRPQHRRRPRSDGRASSPPSPPTTRARCS